jgi:hypothetical protein
MSVQEDLHQDETLLSRPPYMGSQRASALEDDTEEAESAFPDLVEAKAAAEEEAKDDQLGAEETTYKKRYGDARRHMTKLQQELKEAKAAAENAVQEATPKWTPPKSDEQMQAFREENPETADVLDTIAYQRIEESNAEVTAMKKELDEERLQRKEEEASFILNSRHPDFDDIRATDEFHDWVEAQSQTIQDGVYVNTTDGDLASRILDLYKLDAGITADKANSTKKKDADLKLEASKLVSSTGGPEMVSDKRIFTTSEIDSMPDEIYDELQEEIRVANVEGRVVEG